MYQGRVVAFVRRPDEGPILYVQGKVFEDEVASAGADLSDHVFPRAESGGLQVFEGWVEAGSGPEPDVLFRGEWRLLTHWEMCRVRCGKAPW